MRRSHISGALLIAGLAAALVFACIAGKARTTSGADAPAESMAPPPVAEARAPAPQEAARAPVEPEPAMGFEGPLDPPTPRAARAGHALLRVEVVALEDEQPLAGIDLMLVDETGEMPPFSTQRDPARGLDGDSLVTDANGRGEFVARSGRAFELVAHGDNGEAEAAVAPLAEGEARSVRVALRASGETWSVRVLDGESEQPIAGAAVRVLNAYSDAALREVVGDASLLDDVDDDDPPLVAEGRTDAAGRFVTTVPRSGSLFARIEAPGFHFAGCRVASAAEEDEESEVFLLAPAALAVRLLEHDGRPAPGVEVRLRAPFADLVDNAFLHPDPEWRGVTDADGRCAFDALPAAARFAVELRRGDRVVGRPGGTQGELELDARERREIEWMLDGGCRLVGRAHDPAGRALAEIALVLESLEQDCAQLGIADPDAGALRATANVTGNTVVARVVTGAEGGFALDDVGSGTWALGLAPHEGHFLDARLVFAISAGAAEKRVDLRLDPAAHIYGRVLAPDGTPGRARVTATGVGPGGEPLAVSEWTGIEGEFHLSELMDGEYRLDALPSEPDLCAPPPVTARTGTEDVVLQLARGATATVRVRYAGGAPARAEVFLFPVGGTDEAGWETSLREGLARFENVAPGTYDMVARSREGEVCVLRSVELRAARSDELVLRLAPARPVTVRTTARAHDDKVRVELLWEGRRIDFLFAGDEPNRMFTLPGPVTVRWVRIDAAMREVFLHEASGVAEEDAELAFEYAVE